MNNLFLNIKRLLQLRNIKHGRSYLINNGFTDSEARLVLSGNMKEMKFTMLERLGILFNCTADQLLDYRGGSNGPWAAISKRPLPDMAKLLANKSPKEIEEILKKITKSEGF